MQKLGMDRLTKMANCQKHAVARALDPCLEELLDLMHLHERNKPPGPANVDDPDVPAGFTMISGVDGRANVANPLQYGGSEIRTRTPYLKVDDSMDYVGHTPKASYTIQTGVVVNLDYDLDDLDENSVTEGNLYLPDAENSFFSVVDFVVKVRKAMSQSSDNFGCFLNVGFYSRGHRDQMAQYEATHPNFIAQGINVRKVENQLKNAVCKSLGAVNFNCLNDYNVSLNIIINSLFNLPYVAAYFLEKVVSLVQFSLQSKY